MRKAWSYYFRSAQIHLSSSSVAESCPFVQNSSGKMVLLDKLLPKLRAEGHKVRTMQTETLNLANS